MLARAYTHLQKQIAEVGTNTKSIIERKARIGYISYLLLIKLYRIDRRLGATLFFFVNLVSMVLCGWQHNSYHSYTYVNDALNIHFSHFLSIYANECVDWWCSYSPECFFVVAIGPPLRCCLDNHDNRLCFISAKHTYAHIIKQKKGEHTYTRMQCTNVNRVCDW